jgi:rod shape-determining protein MreD
VATSLACVFFWTLFRPSAMAPPQVFVIGLLVDLLGFAPVGVNVLTLLVTHGLAMLWRRFLTRQGFFLVWLAFLVVTVGVAVLQWLMTSLLTLALLPPWPVLFQAALAAGLYPLLAVLLTRAHQSLGQGEPS